MTRTFQPERFTEDKVESLQKNYAKLFKWENLAVDLAPVNVDWKNAQFKLKLVDSWETLQVHHYFYQLISSFPNNANDAVGFRLLYNLWETNSNKIVGVLRISNDFLELGPRDKHLGIDTSNVGKGPQFTLQLKGVIPLPPFNRLAGGKLLAALAFSDEVIKTIVERQGHDIAGISVCSIYGESIIYDRIPYLKYLGETPKPTGVYFGATANNSKDFMQGKTKTLDYFKRPASSIIEWWRPLYLRRLEKVTTEVTLDDFKVSVRLGRHDEQQRL